MKPRRRVLVTLALLVVAAAVAVAIVSVAAGSSSPRSTSSSPASPSSSPRSNSRRNRAPARADARKRLDAFAPPPGSHTVPSLPKSLDLDVPAQIAESPNVIDLHRYWVSTEPVKRVRAYLAKHLPAGAHRGFTATEGGSRGNNRWDYGYAWPELPEVATERELLASVAARPGGGSALRVDAQAIWLEARPRSERVPAGAAFLRVKETLGKESRAVNVSDPATVERIVTLLDGMPILQNSGGVECGMLPEERAELVATFRAAPGGPVLAQSTEELPSGYCPFVGLKINGTARRGLFDEEEGLVKSLQKLLATKYGKPLSAGIPF